MHAPDTLAEVAVLIPLQARHATDHPSFYVTSSNANPQSCRLRTKPFPRPCFSSDKNFRRIILKTACVPQPRLAKLPTDVAIILSDEIDPCSLCIRWSTARCCHRFQAPRDRGLIMSRPGKVFCASLDGPSLRLSMTMRRRTHLEQVKLRVCRPRPRTLLSNDCSDALSRRS
ncbi:hypothetical protein IQ07DRAFT_316299 [Pyrenochaeta sp. DS3sAY3a]|nr:hypothetical protein IQ07DRAFT_316299 [Pyrenochaeta sp. DS3sAY3a]